MKITETDILIERYFEATATAAEEARLKAILADPATEPTEAVEEARAVMGLTAVRKAVAQRPQEPTKAGAGRWIAAASVAAAVAVAAIMCLEFQHEASVTSTATIYARGTVTHSTDLAMDIMAVQLGAMGEASANSPASDILRILESTTDNQ